MERLEVVRPSPENATELAAVAARTFPLACPPTASPDDVVAFIDAHLSPLRFAEYLDDPQRTVLAALDNSRIIGYCMLIRGLPDDDADVAQAVTVRPTVELSKMYVLPDHHGMGVSAALMVAALDAATAMPVNSIWLGVNQQNQRAQRFYTKHGFTIHGTKAFHLGRSVENDYVMVRPI